METVERSWAIPIIVIASLFVISGMVAAQDSTGKAAVPSASGTPAVKPLFVAKKDTQISWDELRDKYGWNGRPPMATVTTRGEKITGGINEKTGLFMTKGRFALDNLEIDGEIGQGPKGVLFKQGTKILGRR